MSDYQNDEQLFALMKTELFTSVVGDVMDTLGLTRQFLPPSVRPLRSDMTVVGRAMTVLEADCYAGQGSGQGPLSDRPFGLMFHALDDLKPGEVYLASATAGEYAMWGELMTSRAQQLGAAGAVLCGYSRDTRAILDGDWPVFSVGSYGQDQGVRGKVVDYRVPIEVGRVRVEPGDLVFGDIDGVLTVPQRVESEVIAAALEKIRGEQRVSDAIRGGMSSADAFNKFGIM